MNTKSLKSVTKAFEAWRLTAKDYIYRLRHPKRRDLASLEHANEQGQLNGMTVVELLTFVRLTEATGERVVLRAIGKTLIIVAESMPEAVPTELA